MALRLRDHFFAKPALGVLIGFVPGILLAEAYPSRGLLFSLFLLACVAIASTLVSYFLPRIRKPLLGSYWAVLAGSLALGYLINYHELTTLEVKEFPQRAFLKGVLISPPTESKSAIRWHMRVLDDQPFLAGKGLMLYAYKQENDTLPRAKLGDTLAVSIFRVLPREENIRPSYRNWLRSKNCVATARLATFQPTNLTLYPRGKAVTLREKASDSREELLERIEKLPYSQETKSFIATIILGYRTDGVASLSQAFRSLGTAHILSVSGFHLVVVCGFFLFIVRFFDRFPRVRFVKPLVAILIAWLFAFLTGLSPATIRAALMLTLYQLSYLLMQPRNSINVLAFTALLLLGIHPGYLFNVGFQLSFASVLSILLFYPFFQVPHRDYLNPIVYYLYNALAVTISAQPLTVPLLMHHFGSTPLLFLWSNIPLVALASLIIPMALMLVLLMPWLSEIPWIYSWWIASLESLISYVYKVVDFLTPASDISLNIRLTATQTTGLYLIIFACYLLILRSKALKRASTNLPKRYRTKLRITHSQKERLLDAIETRNQYLLSRNAGEADTGCTTMNRAHSARKCNTRQS